MQKVSKTPQETKKIAKDLALRLKPGDVIALWGELGAGKTTFVQGMAEGLGVKERIISPTFLIIREHNMRQGKFYHIDLYRINSEDEIHGLGFQELIKERNNIVAIEWAEKIKNLLPGERIDVYLKYKSENERTIEINERKP